MKLYFSPAACSLSPHIVINELGLSVEFIHVDVLKTHTFKNGESFYDVNPLGYVPALQLDDGNLLLEGPAIVQYLADLKPESGLLAKNGTFERYQFQEMLNFLSTEIHKGIVEFYHSHYGKEKLLQRFDRLDQILSKKKYLMGSDFTLPDAYLFALIGWVQASWITSYYLIDIHLDDFTNIKDWYEKVKIRPAVIKSLQEEKLIKT